MNTPASKLPLFWLKKTIEIIQPFHTKKLSNWINTNLLPFYIFIDQKKGDKKRKSLLI